VSGIGTHSKELSQKFNVVAVGWSEEKLVWGVKNGNYDKVKTLIKGELKDVPEELHGSFDAVFSYEHLELYGGEKTIKKLYDLLKPGVKVCWVGEAYWENRSFFRFYNNIEPFIVKASKHFDVKTEYIKDNNDDPKWCIITLEKASE
jgi:cyclopropane fatty-acyl-phospholipid synthase-like methyltransferase